MQLLAAAIPVFLALIALEAVVARRMGRKVAHAADTLSSISCGATDQLVNLFAGAGFLAAYAALHARAALVALPSSPWAWALLVLILDFAYYWFHRVSHRVNVLWAAHAVHHQSRELNLGVTSRPSRASGGSRARRPT